MPSPTRRDVERHKFHEQRKHSRSSSLARAQEKKMHETTVSYSMIQREKMPASSFKGKQHEEPIKFLREMKRYLNPKEISVDEIKYLLTRSLKGIANRWWDMIENSVRSYDDFEK